MPDADPHASQHPSRWERYQAWMMRERPGAGWWVFLLVGGAIFLVRCLGDFRGTTDALLIASSWACLLVGLLVLYAGRQSRRLGHDAWKQKVKSRWGSVAGVIFYIVGIGGGFALMLLLAR